MIIGCRYRAAVYSLLGAVLACSGLVTMSGAVRVHLPSPKPKTVALPGAFAGLVNPENGSYYQSDPFGLGEEFSFVVVLDTGASGNLLTQFVAGSDFGLGIPLTGETFSDEGIGGIQSFDVSVPTELMLAGISVGLAGADNPSSYTSYGPYSFQVERPSASAVPVDIVGTPVLNQFVMHVQPNEPSFNPTFPFLDLLPTNLLPTLPDHLVGPGVHRVMIEYVDFISQTSSPVDVDKNPVIPQVRIVDDRQDPSAQAIPRDLVFDSGGSITVIGRNFAEDVGIDLVNEMPIDQVTVTGVGSSPRNLFGYQVDELVLPLVNNHELVFVDPVVFVPDEGTLPADLDGILGMNLLGPSFSQQDLFGLPSDTESGLFSDWYLDPISSQLVLVENTSWLAGDFNLDDQVDPADFALLSNSWLTAGDWTEGDTNGDGFIDPADFAVLSDHWLAGTVPNGGQLEAVPEPSAVSLTVIGLLTVFTRLYQTRRGNA